MISRPTTASMKNCENKQYPAHSMKQETHDCRWKVQIRTVKVEIEEAFNTEENSNYLKMFSTLSILHGT